MKLITLLFLFISLWLGAGLTKRFQKLEPLTASDTQTIITMMFEREFKGRDRVGEILLSSRLDSARIPKTGRFNFRQLKYGEENKVSEYYEISFRTEKNYVEASLTKGNLCVKAGPRYRFTKKGSSWIVQDVEAIQTLSDPGTCPGCVVGSGRIYTPFPRPPFSSKVTPGLRLEGKVDGITCSRAAQYVNCQIKLKLQFSNTAEVPVIFMRPIKDDEYWHGETSLAFTRAALVSYEFIHAGSAWPSIYIGEPYKRVARELDQPIPPEHLTHTLKPGEFWTWNTSVHWGVNIDNTCASNREIGVEIGWREIEKLKEPLWMRVSYQIWPFNVENFKPRLGLILKKRWANLGTFYVEKSDGKYSTGNITSEPIELDFRGVTVVNSK